jgi:CheY-like chemotaxis protein
MTSKILVVDDDPPILKGIEMVLRNVGYDTKTTLKGEETLGLVESYQPDLILMDIMLAGMDGREIAKELKSAEATKHIPIVLISANQAMGKDIEKYGVETFISKPFSSKQLISIIEKYCT